MPVPNGPYIVIQSGFQSPNPFPADGNQYEFSWYNSGGGNCSVTGVGNFCTASSYSNLPGGGSAKAYVKSGVLTGSYSYTSACCQSNQSVKITGLRADSKKR